MLKLVLNIFNVLYLMKVLYIQFLTEKEFGNLF